MLLWFGGPNNTASTNPETCTYLNVLEVMWTSSIAALEDLLGITPLHIYVHTKTLNLLVDLKD